MKETVVKTIDMGGAVEQPVADGKGMLYDNNEDNQRSGGCRYARAKGQSAMASQASRRARCYLDGQGAPADFLGRPRPSMLVMMDADNGKSAPVVPHRRRSGRERL